MYLIDSHCHIHGPWFDEDAPTVIENAKENNIKKIFNCASYPENYDFVLNTTEHENVFAHLGIQPTLADEYTDSDPIENHINHDQVVAVGEVGLDYYWDKEEKKREMQEQLFVKCIKLANNYDMPLVVHSRKAESESLDLLEQHSQTPILLHSFDGNLKEVNRAVDLGYKITVPTIVTRRKNRRKVTTRAGLENIMIETDAPFMEPKEDIDRNEPKFIPIAAKYMANLLDVEYSELVKTTSKNAEEFYGV